METAKRETVFELTTNNAIAFAMFCAVGFLREPHPRNEDGSLKDYWQMYELFLTHEKRQTYLNHAASRKLPSLTPKK